MYGEAIQEPVVQCVNGRLERALSSTRASRLNIHVLQSEMSHHDHSGHDHGGSHAAHDHSDDLEPALQSLLYNQIEFGKITTLNETRADAGSQIVKKIWSQRLDATPILTSDADEQLLMTVP